MKDKKDNKKIGGEKVAYICGPLTDLSAEERSEIRNFYDKIADVCEEATGLRAFAPHENYDSPENQTFSPQDIDDAERNQVCNKTSILIAVYIAPSWGGGIEVEMARQSGVPIIILCPKGKKITRLLLGNRNVVKVIYYENEAQALDSVKDALCNP